MKTRNHLPPQAFVRLFRWFCHPKLRDHIEGDLMEEYNQRLSVSKKSKADMKFIMDVILLFRPGIIRPAEGARSSNPYGMYKSFLKAGWRNLLNNKGISAINIGGLALGITVAMLIGLWINDELSFNKYHGNYETIAQVWNGGTNPETGAIDGGFALQFPTGATLKNNYPHYFKHVLIAWWPQGFTLATEDEKFKKQGLFIEGGIIEMLSLKMLKGTNESLAGQNSIIISRSAALSIFGDIDPMNKTLKIDNRIDAEVTGVYEDIPKNNRFSDIQFISTWSLWVASNDWLKQHEFDWDNRMTNVYVQLESGITAEATNAVVRDLYYKNMPDDYLKTVDKYKPFLQVVPMNTWHLYSELKDGKPEGGRIAFVWLFGIVGSFVLLLACINFINLSTARSERRAREVGVRKAIGSGSGQLITQFLFESLLVVTIAFIASVLVVTLSLPWFNDLAEKDIVLPLGNPILWALALGFILLTGLMAGLYPAFYLSSFQPAKVLKGVLRMGNMAALPRKFLVVVQFTVSVILIIGTLVVHQQVKYARDRPVGFDRQGLISLRTSDPEYYTRRDALTTELLNSGVVAGVATSSNPLTQIWNTTNGYVWPGKDPNAESDFVNCNVTYDFGKTIGWELVAGRDFSRDFPSDSADAIIINEAAAKYMGLKDPVGKEFTDLDELGNWKWTRKIIGVVKDMVMGSPYEPASQTIFFFNNNSYNLMHIRIEPTASAGEALPMIEAVFKKVAPSILFDYQFVDGEHARKFNEEERVGQLSAVFSALAIFISCLGLFGLASFVAGRRTKEIGIRKVMGASVFNLWRMLSKEFVVLVIISCVIAVPIGSYFMSSWLDKYAYRTGISWWIILATCVAALVITLLTVSYQSIKAAMMNPVSSLRSE